MRRRAAALVGLLVSGSAAVRAQEIGTLDVHVRKLPGLPAGAVHGDYEHAFEVVNDSADRAHEVRLVIPDSDDLGGGTHVLRRMTHAVTVGPRSAARLALHQPPLPLAGGGVRVIVDGRALPGTLVLGSAHPSPSFFVAGPGGGRPSAEASLRVLVSQRMAVAALPEDPDLERYLRATIPVAAWSDDWLAYSGYDGIVLASRELDEMSAGTRRALVRYVETGGSLTVAGEWPSAELAAALRRWGPAAEERGWKVTYAGFGTVLAGSLGPDAGAAAERLESSWFRSRGAWTMLRDPGGVHRLFSVKADVRVPVRGIFLVVVAFTLLIGPVNLALLTRRRRRIWMLWTVPAMALVASLIVFLYALLSEGLIRVERSASLTVLDQRSHRAATLGWVGYYSTLTPGGGLVFDRDTEVSPVVQWSWAGAGSGGRTLDWRDGQRLTSGWITARLPSYFFLRKGETRRERVGVRRGDGGALVATNGLGAAVESLVLADSEGRLYAAQGRLEAGASIGLVAQPRKAAGARAALRELYRGELPGSVNELVEHPAAHLRPGTYVARLAASPFLERALRDVREARTEAVVYGILDDEGPGGSP